MRTILRCCRRLLRTNWAEYFIGIGKDQNEVLQAKSKFDDLDPPNASSFWGDAQKLLPNIPSKSIDNFILILPTKFVTLTSKEEKLAFKSLFGILPDKLRIKWYTSTSYRIRKKEYNI